MASTFDVKSEHEIIVNAYKEFDKLNKGYISADQFRNMVSDLLPHLNPSNIDSIFAAADMYKVDKVTRIYHGGVISYMTYYPIPF